MSDAFEKIFPHVQKFDVESMKNDAVTYIGASGFEDRSLETLRLISKSRKKLKNVVGIEYAPFNHKNRKNEFELKMNETASQEKLWMLYDRYEPESFLPSLEKIGKICRESDATIVDVSSMSKFLIVLLLYSLRNLPKEVKIVYCEADTYHPTKEKFEEEKTDKTGAVPTFLTSSVYKVVISKSLFGNSIQGMPILLISFPTFNQKETVALLDKFIPEKAVFFEGIPHKEYNKWRLDAVKYINRDIEKDVLFRVKETDWRQLSTFDYVETISCLEDVYNQFQASHSYIVAPTGSKFQSVSICFFKQMHPDIHIVYPVTKQFAEEYTDGVTGIWEINIENYALFTKALDRYRWKGTDDLKKKIAEYEKKTPHL